VCIDRCSYHSEADGFKHERIHQLLEIPLAPLASNELLDVANQNVERQS